MRGSIKQLSFRYSLRADYTCPVRNHNFSFTFLPADTRRQEVTALTVDIPGCTGFRESAGSFGSSKLYGCIRQPHDTFEILVSGTVKTGLDIFEEYTADPLSSAVFQVQSALTVPGEAIRAYHASLTLSGGAYDRALSIMNSLYAAFRYRPGNTSAHEPAEAAFSKGQGVCQDFAHVMLSLLRMEGIPARYVTGMTLGEGASHAWVEALCNGYWYGFDPTNNLLVDDGYIRAGCGRDSADCAIIRGVFYGPAAQTQWERVAVQAETEETL